MRSSRPDALLAAYLDGVSELEPGERREVEAWLRDHPAATADADATRALLGQLRELPPVGDEPRWTEMEHAIRDAIGATPPPRRFRWSRWAMPAVGLVMAAAALVLWLSRSDVATPVKTAHAPVFAPTTAHPIVPAPTAPVPATAPGVAPTLSVWLDGQPIDIDNLDDSTAVLDGVEADTMAAAGADDTGANDGLLPSSDLGWIDELDPAAIERLDGWLPRTKG